MSLQCSCATMRKMEFVGMCETVARNKIGLTVEITLARNTAARLEYGRLHYSQGAPAYGSPCYGMQGTTGWSTVPPHAALHRADVYAADDGWGARETSFQVLHGS